MSIPLVETPKKSRRSRSTGFPTISLEEALSLLEMAKSAGLEMSNDLFAGEINMSPKGSAFLSKLAALRDFKLIEKTADKVIYADLAKDILFDTSGEPIVKKGKLQEAFRNCKIFNDIFSRLYQGGGDSKKITVGNIAVRELGVSPQSQNRFVKSFVDSGKIAELISETEDGSLHIVSEKSQEPAMKKEAYVDQHSPFPQFPPSSSFSPPPPVYEGYSRNIEEKGEDWSLHISIKSSKPLSKTIRTNINSIIDALEENNDQPKNSL